MEAIGLAGSVISIIGGITSTIKHLHQLHKTYEEADLTISLLTTQLLTLKAALAQICEWITSSLYTITEQEQLVTDLETLLEGCQALILVLGDYVRRANMGQSGELSIRTTLRYMWDEEKIKGYLNHLGNQANALNLLLTAFQCRSLFERHDLLSSDESRRTIKRVADDTSSLLCLHDVESRLSWSTDRTENSALLNTEFDFDSEIIQSRAYQSTLRSIMKRSIHNSQRERLPPTSRQVEVNKLAARTSQPDDFTNYTEITKQISPNLREFNESDSWFLSCLKNNSEKN